MDIGRKSFAPGGIHGLKDGDDGAAGGLPRLPDDFPGFVDIHAHVLPGLDDGPKDMPASLEFLAAMQAAGVRRVCAATHHMKYGEYSSDFLTGECANLERIARGHGIGVEIIPASEIPAENDVPDRLARGELLTVGGRNEHILLEPENDTGVNENLARICCEILAQGITPVVVHPERGVRADGCYNEILRGIAEAGAILQITGASLMGNLGDTAAGAAWSLVHAGLAGAVASDAHGASSHRLSDFVRSYARLSESLERRYVQKLFFVNPGLVAFRPG